MQQLDKVPMLPPTLLCIVINLDKNSPFLHEPDHECTDLPILGGPHKS